jgi:hypothetical protein
MLTIMVHAKVKEEKLAEYLELAALLTGATKGKRAGCISYSFNQSLASPTEFVLYEQWESQGHLDDHIRALCELLGQPVHGKPLPEKLMNLYEWARPVFYREVGREA